MLIHDCDLRVGLHAKRIFDAVGHYSRADLLGDVAPGNRGGAPEAAPGGNGAPAEMTEA